MSRPPYELTPPPPLGRDPEGWRRYQRSRRLVAFAGDLAMWERAGLIDSPRHAERVRYRREALGRWEEYLDGWTPEKPRGAGGRPPRLKG